MSIPAGIREQVRRRAEQRCEFCGIHETDAGGELTLDHFRPKSRGGGDDLDNLIYACSRCNLFKHDYWPQSPGAPHLWNPRKEPSAAHFVELDDGTLESRSATGAFTLRQLRLNRPQLVAKRRQRRRAKEAIVQLGAYRGIITVLRQLLAQQSVVVDQQGELLQELRELLAWLLSSRH